MGDLKMFGVAAKEFQVCQEIRLALPASSSSPNTLSLAEIPVASPFFVRTRAFFLQASLLCKDFIIPSTRTHILPMPRYQACHEVHFGR